jgi:CBS domain-containing protein
MAATPGRGIHLVEDPMKVRELLRRKGSKVISTEPGTSVGSVVQLLLRHNIGAMPVVSADNKLVGIFGERDLLRAFQLHGGRIEDLPVEQVMQRQLPTCDANATLRELMGRMTRERLRHVLIMENGEVAGIVSVGDIVKHRLDQLETETNILRDIVTAARAGA